MQFASWPPCLAHVECSSHWSSEFFFKSVGATSSHCLSCKAQLPFGTFANLSELFSHVKSCSPNVLEALSIVESKAFQCTCSQDFDSWTRCLAHLNGSMHLDDLPPLAKLARCLKLDMGLPMDMDHLSTPGPLPSTGAVVSYQCADCGFEVEEELSFLLHLLQSAHVANEGPLAHQLARCVVTSAVRRGGNQPKGAAPDNAKAAKEQKAFDILVEACHAAKNGLADPSTLRALQPLLPKGTLRKFIGRHSDTFEVVESTASRAGWYVSFKRDRPAGAVPDTVAPTSSLGPTRVTEADAAQQLLQFIALFAAQSHTTTLTLSAPLAAKQIPLARDSAQAHGLHCHLLAHRLVLSKTEITAEVVNDQASKCDWLFDPKLQEINLPLREFLADKRLPSLRTTNVPSKVFRYLEDLAHAGCSFSVIRLPDSSVKVLKLAAVDSGDVLLKDFFAQSHHTQRIVQLPQQQVRSTAALEDSAAR
eukprot:EG_transcript_11071